MCLMVSRYLQRQGPKLLQVGNKTECAMLGFIESHGANYEAIRQRAVVHRVYQHIVILLCFCSVLYTWIFDLVGTLSLQSASV